METKAPLIPAMERLQASDTVVFRQLTQYAEAFLPITQQNKYVVSAAPEGVRARTGHSERGWSPTGTDLRSLGAFLFGYEMSALWERCLLTICGGANLRAMSMNFIPAEEVEKLNATGWQNMNKNADVLGEQGMRLDRPCLPGGCCGVPFRIFVSSGGGDELGVVRENFSPYSEKCFACVCQCTHYHDVFAKGSEEPVYQIVVGKACCGAHNNCCGATCFKESMIFDVLDKDGKKVATIEKIFAREEEGCLGGVCRALHDFSNYVVSFPPGASLEEKQLLLGALTQVEYLYFVPEGGDSGGGGGD